MTDPAPFQIGDHVRKISGYQFSGIVRAVYLNGDGEWRIVVEFNGDGPGFIFKPEQIEKTPLKQPMGSGDRDRLAHIIRHCGGPNESANAIIAAGFVKVETAALVEWAFAHPEMRGNKSAVEFADTVMARLRRDGDGRG